MAELDAYFAETMPDDERLTNYRAFTRGAAAGLQFYLARMRGYHDLLEQELERSPTGQRYWREQLLALDQAERLLLELQQVGGGQTEQADSLDLVVLLRGVASRLQKIGLVAATVHADAVKGQSAFVRGSLFMLQQAFFELPHFFPNPGHQPLALHVHLRLESLERDYFAGRNSALAAGGYYVVSLSPRPAAPATDDLVCLTEKLVTCPQLDLGGRLVFTHGIVLAHGGELFSDRGPDTLNMLAVVLPSVSNRVGMFEERGVQESDLRGKETILLVDDEGIIWDVVIDMLQGLGYTVILAENGKDCVEIYQSNPGKIDLVLLDMVMPEMNGHDAFFALKQLDPEVKVLLQSGYMAQEEAQDVLDAGARGFLQKPYRMLELARKIREVLKR